MRIFPIALSLLAACAHQRMNESGQPIRGSDPVPDAVAAAAPHAVAVYVDARCGRLDEASVRGSGFWITPRIVVTAGHALERAQRTFPEFAIVAADGSCVNGQYAGSYETADVLFILARETHPKHLALETRSPTPGETAYQVSLETLDGTSGRAEFSHRRLTVTKALEGTAYFNALPVPRLGDSGSPLLDARGRVLGMAIAIGHADDDPAKTPVGLYIGAAGIKGLLDACGPCEEE